MKWVSQKNLTSLLFESKQIDFSRTSKIDPLYVCINKIHTSLSKKLSCWTIEKIRENIHINRFLTLENEWRQVSLRRPLALHILWRQVFSQYRWNFMKHATLRNMLCQRKILHYIEEYSSRRNKRNNRFYTNYFSTSSNEYHIFERP